MTTFYNLFAFQTKEEIKSELETEIKAERDLELTENSYKEGYQTRMVDTEAE